MLGSTCLAARISTPYRLRAFALNLLVCSLIWPTDALAAASDSDGSDTWIKLVAGGAAAVAAVLGVPYAFLQIQKTRLEIRKAEGEVGKLVEAASAEGTRITLHESPGAHVQILADPRFLGPLLLLLDFIVAWIVLTLCGFVLSFFGFYEVTNLILGLIGALLLIPIFREARRVKRSLAEGERGTFVAASSAEGTSENSGDSTNLTKQSLGPP